MNQSKSQRGVVKSFRKNHHDDVDGIILEDETELRFPPHVGHRVVDAISVGDEIQFDGQLKTRPHGEEVFEANSIKFGKTVIVVDHPHKKPPRDHSEPPMEASGRVRDFHLNHHGETDGFQLEDGTVIKFPPHRGPKLLEIVSERDEVSVTGRRHETPKGDVHLHADSIVNQRTKQAVQRHDDAEVDGAPESGSNPTNAELMRELKSIRRLVEAWGEPQ